MFEMGPSGDINEPLRRNVSFISSVTEVISGAKIRCDDTFSSETIKQGPVGEVPTAALITSGLL